MLTSMSAETKFVFDSIYLFTYSLFNATVGTASPNTDICQANIYILDSGINALIIQFENYVYQDAGDTIEGIL
jgi:hypothetical protein